MDPLFEHSFFDYLAEELNQVCSGEKRWSGDDFYFLSKIKRDRAFKYDATCEDDRTLPCDECNELIFEKQCQLTERIKLYRTNKNKDYEIAILKRDVKLLNEKIDIMNRNFNEKIDMIMKEMKK